MASLEQKLVGVIINPNAKQNQKDPRLRYRLEKIGGDITLVRESRDLDHLREIVTEFLAERLEKVVCFGGDGTYQVIITEILKQIAQENISKVNDRFHQDPNTFHQTKIRKIPYIYPGRRGTINYTAKSAEINGNPEEILDRIIEACRSGETPKTYPLQTLEVRSFSRDDPDENVNLDYGFVFGAAGVSNFLRKFYGKDETQEVRKLWSLLNRMGHGLEETILGTDFATRILDRLIQNTTYAIDKPGVVKAFRIIAKCLGSFALSPLGTTYHKEILDPDSAKVIVDGEALPYDQYNILLASSLKIRVIGTDAFYRLNGVNHDGRIHLYAGNEPYLNLVKNFIRTFSPGFKPNFKKGTDKLIDDMVIETQPGFYYNLDAEMKESAGVIEVRLGPVIEIPEIR